MCKFFTFVCEIHVQSVYTHVWNSCEMPKFIEYQVPGAVICIVVSLLSVAIIFTCCINEEFPRRARLSVDVM